MQSGVERQKSGVKDKRERIILILGGIILVKKITRDSLAAENAPIIFFP